MFYMERLRPEVQTPILDLIYRLMEKVPLSDTPKNNDGSACGTLKGGKFV